MSTSSNGHGHTHAAAASTGALLLDAPALYAQLLHGVRNLRSPQTQLLGITSGGAWLAQALHADLGLPGKHGVISSTMHRDDFAQRGLASSAQTHIPFDVNGADIILLDDVLYTGRTIRAVVNELYDYGRPASVQLAVLVDRGGRELPVAAAYAAATVQLHSSQRLSLVRSDGDGGKLSFALQGPSGEGVC
jgi:pyrimidine operon attenuation protein / uracil phosphoribosyltransferase